MNAGRNFVKCLECGEIIHLPDDTEDNQPQAESGTTGCLAAGGGIEQSKPGRLAGREPCSLEAFEAWCDSQFKCYAKRHNGDFQSENFRLAKLYEQARDLVNAYRSGAA